MLLKENVNAVFDIFIFKSSYYFVNLIWDDNLFFINFINDDSSSTQILLDLIEQLENFDNLKNFENLNSVYQYSVPNVKLWYPEPFIASPSFMHADLWFMHILIYQYWLWFVFIFIIVFFFITFISTVRWCNMRVRPRKETRGVSRSKCGDLITACVPVTWATSIIVNESTDAIDFYDGFGTTELVVGIRAYQWGWEYYYPRDIDLNYNLKNSYSTYTGNSLKYNRTSDVTVSAVNFWKFYQNKTSDQVLTPAHLLVIPLNDCKIINVLNFADSGTNNSFELNSFKQTKLFSKFNKTNLFYQPYNLTLNYLYLQNLYFSHDEFSESLSVGAKTQFNFLPFEAHQNSQSSFSTLKILDKFYRANLETFLNNSSSQAFSYVLKFTKKFNAPVIKNFQNDLRFFEQNYSLQSLNFDLKSLKNSLTSDLSTSYEIADTFDSAFFNENNSFSNFKFHFESPVTSIFGLTLNWPAHAYFYKNISLPNTSEKLVWPMPSTSIFAEPLKTNPLNVLSNTEKTTRVFRGNSLDSYWTNFKFLEQLNNKIIFNNSFLKTLRQFYLPNISLYYDYDFRNWQFFQCVEDSYWESILSAYASDEYDSISQDFFSSTYADKNEKPYFALNPIFKRPDLITETSTISEESILEDFYSSSLILEDNAVPSSLINTKNFNSYANYLMLFGIEDSFPHFKSNLFLLNKSGLNQTNSVSSLTIPQSHLNVFDYFNSEFDLFAWFFDENYLNFDFSNLNSFSLNFLNPKITDCVYYNFLQNESEFAEYEVQYLTDYTDELFNQNSPKFVNLLNTRLGAKSSLSTFNALQKVFRARFDEGRSHAKIESFSSSFPKQQFISTYKTNYEKAIGKTHENFFKINYFKNVFKFNYMYNYESFNSLNYFTYDFPFLIGLKSDASKYYWFDWFAKWGFYEVQPASTSKYAIFGMPYFNKPFEFQDQFVSELNESENYLTRISRARRNYITNWTHLPYLFAKNFSWYLNDYVFEVFEDISNLLLISQGLMECAIDQMELTSFDFEPLNKSFYFHPSHSGTSTFTRSDIRPKHSIQSYYYTSSQLVDILTKREYLYRELFVLNKKIFSLPSHLTAGANNPLLNEIKSSFNFVDPINLINEYSRSNYLFSINYFNYLIFKVLAVSLFEDLSYFDLKSVFFNFITNANFSESMSSGNLELFKNQYRPMRKSVSNMLRLHASGAVSMPIEIRMQILASSRDVIHSWAVPSAGIKIDCVPGYSSHKVMIFFLSGIFWGQCMEICGRYHHWMPIIVFFMKRDLFFLWCVHFAYLNNYSLFTSINDKQFANYSKQISHNKNAWVLNLIF